MPRYFFHFENDDRRLEDLIGTDLASDQAAKAQALKLAADLAVEDAVKGNPPRFDWVEVVDEDDCIVARLPVADAIREPNRIR
jgi:hypothetical protein